MDPSPRAGGPIRDRQGARLDIGVREYSTLSGGTANLAYDAAGNLTSDGDKSYAYDAFGRLSAPFPSWGAANARGGVEGWLGSFNRPSPGRVRVRQVAASARHGVSLDSRKC